MFGCLNLSSAFGGSSPARRVQCAALNLDGLKCLQAAILRSPFCDLRKSRLTRSKPEKYATGKDTHASTETQPPEDNFGTEKSPKNSNSGHELDETLASSWMVAKTQSIIFCKVKKVAISLTKLLQLHGIQSELNSQKSQNSWKKRNITNVRTW